MKKGRGFSLVEVIVTVALIAIVFLPIATLFPTGVLSLKKAENRQTAVYLAKESVEEVREMTLPLLPDPFGPNLQLDETGPLQAWVAGDSTSVRTRNLNSTAFTITRRVWAIRGMPGLPPSLVDVTVRVEYPGAISPVDVSSRFFREK